MSDKKNKYENGFIYDPYTASEEVTSARSALDSHLANKPTAYTSKYETQMGDVTKQILNREKFSYDFNNDPLYQQYKDQYTRQGEAAMKDTIGRASALSGGYGNSYAQSVGQQTYQGYLDQLNDKIPELYQLALNMYTQEGQDMYGRYSLLEALDNRDYGRHRDSVSDWKNEREYLTGRYDSEREFDYGKYADERSHEYTKYLNELPAIDSIEGYLDTLEKSGDITPEQADDIYKIYRGVDESSESEVDAEEEEGDEEDILTRWFIDSLVAGGMTRSEAKEVMKTRRYESI